MSEMKPFVHFKPKMFAAVLVVCVIVAGAVAWATELNFWILAGILVGAVLVNGLITSIEDSDTSKKKEIEVQKVSK